ncbi:MAG: hypothetical protein AB1797_11895, partial [bacterium]
MMLLLTVFIALVTFASPSIGADADEEKGVVIEEVVVTATRGEKKIGHRFKSLLKKGEIGLHFLFSNRNTKKSQTGFQSGKRLFMFAA